MYDFFARLWRTLNMKRLFFRAKGDVPNLQHIEHFRLKEKHSNLWLLTSFQRKFLFVSQSPLFQILTKCSNFKETFARAIRPRNKTMFVVKVHTCIFSHKYLIKNWLITLKLRMCIFRHAKHWEGGLGKASKKKPYKLGLLAQPLLIPTYLQNLDLLNRCNADFVLFYFMF